MQPSRSVLARTSATIVLMLAAATAVFADGPLKTFALTPCRLIDTRSANAPALVGNSVRDFQVQGKCGIPVNAKAVMVNAVVVGPQSDGYITLYPSGTAWPGTATVTFVAATPATGTGALVPLSTNANDLSIYLFQALNTQSAHVVVDATAYFCKVDVNDACIP